MNRSFDERRMALHADATPARWKSTFVCAFVAQGLSIVGLSFATPFLPFFVAELGVEANGTQAFWAGLALASGGLTLALLAPVWGIVADRYGRGPMVFRAMLGAAVAMLLMSFSRTVPQLIACRLLHGAFSGTIGASVALVASVVPLSRSGLTLGMMQAAVFIGNAVGPLLGGLAADAFGYRTSFRIGALVTLAGAALVLLGTRETFRPPDPRSSHDSPGFRSIARLPGFLISVGVLFGVRLINTIANPSFPLIVGKILKDPERVNSVTGSIIAAAAVSGAGAAAILGHAGDRMGRRRVLIACCLGGCLASVGQYTAHTVASLLAMRVLLGFAVAGMLPAANATIQAVVDPRSVGRAYGLATSLSMTGMAIGPALGGFLAMHAGLRVPFLVTGAAQLLLALLIYRFLRESDRPLLHLPRGENLP